MPIYKILAIGVVLVALATLVLPEGWREMSYAVIAAFVAWLFIERRAARREVMQIRHGPRHR